MKVKSPYKQFTTVYKAADGSEYVGLIICRTAQEAEKISVLRGGCVLYEFVEAPAVLPLFDTLLELKGAKGVARRIHYLTNLAHTISLYLPWLIPRGLPASFEDGNWFHKWVHVENALTAPEDIPNLLKTIRKAEIFVSWCPKGYATEKAKKKLKGKV